MYFLAGQWFPGWQHCSGETRGGGKPPGELCALCTGTLHTAHHTLHTAHCTMPFLQFRASRTGESISSGQVMDSSHSSHSSLYHRWWAPPMRPDRTTGGQLLTNTLLGQGRFRLVQHLLSRPRKNNFVIN